MSSAASTLRHCISDRRFIPSVAQIITSSRRWQNADEALEKSGDRFGASLSPMMISRIRTRPVGAGDIIEAQGRLS
jgi:hypothetical protein